MRDQYAADVSDVLKFAFLRALAGTDRTLGIAWYHAPGDDGRADGRHLEWQDEPAWQRLDPQLHAWLSMLPEGSRLMSVPGIGPIISSAMIAAIGAGDVFSKGRDFAAVALMGSCSMASKQEPVKDAILK